MSEAAPLYRVIAAALRQAIRSGDIATGDRIPTEQALMERYGVSRHTAREAIQTLRHEGLIDRRRGAGSVVVSPAATGAFSQTIDGLDALLQYARTARLEISAYAAAKISDIARHRLDPNRRWTAIDGLRRVAPDARPVAMTRILVEADLCPSRAAIEAWPGAINALISELHHVRTARIDQTITAVGLGRREARLLAATPGSPALATTRRYHAADDRLIQLSVSLHPGDRFAYTMRLDRD